MTRSAFAFFCLGLAALQIAPAASTAQSELTELWNADKVQLLRGWREFRTAGSIHNAAIKIKLEEGWKTYWRAPGSSGFPPQFDWTGSENLKSVKVLWPAPEIFETEGVRVVGYEREVVLPVIVEPEHDELPVNLHVNVDYGVCKDVCIPTSAQIQESLPAIPEPVDPAILHAAGKIPKIVVSSEHPGLISCRIQVVSATELGVSAVIDVSNQSFKNGVAVIELPNHPVWISDAETRRLDDDRLLVYSSLKFFEEGPLTINRSDIHVTLLSPPESMEIRGCLR